MGVTRIHSVEKSCPQQSRDAQELKSASLRTALPEAHAPRLGTLFDLWHNQEMSQCGMSSKCLLQANIVYSQHWVCLHLSRRLLALQNWGQIKSLFFVTLTMVSFHISYPSSIKVMVTLTPSLPLSLAQLL